ncbi:MAG: DNA polymerase I [Dehalococcoidia bacterium]|nr:DNA polymerase I [Dehalococcoidia bacterium]|tara:strand:+ start:5939 stop:8692 length:2754 start_codon:yes stop_codon:yes gene_type:complete
MSETNQSKKTLLLLDGFAMIFRVFYSRQPMVSSSGITTTVVQGFLSILFKLIKEVNPSHIILALDSKGPTFRHELYPEYKAGREPAPPELTEQIPTLEKVIEAFNIPTHFVEKYEADDIIGTISLNAYSEGFNTVIVSGDKDLFQLINDKTSIWYSSPNRFSSDRLVDQDTYLDEKGFEGIKPNNVPDLKGLAGDSSDNIKGIPGIGQKVANALLNKYENLEKIYENLEKIPELSIRGAVRVQGLLEDNKNKAFTSREIATIKKDAPIDLDLNQSEFWNFNNNEVVDILKNLELMSLINRIPSKKDSSENHNLIPKIKGEYRCANSESMINLMIQLIKKEGVFSFDTETSSLSPFESELVGISISTQPETGWYIPVAHEGAENISESGLQFVKDIFKDPFIEKIAHNANFDVSVLINNNFEINNLNFDTMIAANLLGKRYLGLKNLSLEIFNQEMTPIEDLIGKGKDQISFKNVPLEKAVDYSCADADVTLRLKKIFEKDLDRSELMKVMNEIEVPLIPVIVDMEKTGVSVNTNKLNSLSNDLDSRINILEKNAKGILGQNEINLRSSQQLAKVLIDDLGVPKTKKTKTGYTMDANTLEDLLDNEDLNEDAKNLIKIVLEHREFSKLKSTYSDSIPTLVNKKTERLHTYFNQSGTSTGRLSSSDPNLQNIPVRTEIGNEVRKAFEAKDGHVLMSADYSQIELKILAHLSEEPGLLKAFRNNEDIHDATAKTIYQTENVNKEQRRIAKILNFGVIYGLSPHGVSRQTDLTRAQGKEFINIYFGKYPGIKKYIDDVIEFAKKNKFVETLTKRRRLISEINSPNFQIRSSSERMAINMPIQGSAADVIKIAMININKRIEEEEILSKMIIQVHDELIFEVPEKEVLIMENLLTEIMPKALDLKVPLSIAISNGKTWGDLK